jgi:hypothetical protein
MIEVEFIGKKFPVDSTKPQDQNKTYFTVIIAHFLFRTRPQLTFQQEGYQRGPVHVGRMEMNLRAYAWKQEDINKYKKLKIKEDFDLMKSLNKGLEDAMNALGGDLEKYLEEAGERFEKGKKFEVKEEYIKRAGILDPFISMFKSPTPKKPKKPKKPSATQIGAEEKEKKAATGHALVVLWEVYKNFKKAHGLLAW